MGWDDPHYKTTRLIITTDRDQVANENCQPYFYIFKPWRHKSRQKNYTVSLCIYKIMKINTANESTTFGKPINWIKKVATLKSADGVQRLKDYKHPEKNDFYLFNTNIIKSLWLHLSVRLSVCPSFNSRDYIRIAL